MVMSRDVTAVIPHIPPRADDLRKAVASVTSQTHKVQDIIIPVDLHKEGSAVTRTRGLTKSETTWTAFLDDDDVWYTQHLETLLNEAEESGADVVYSYCVVLNEQGEEIWNPFGQPFDSGLLFQRPYITVVSLVRTGLAKQAGFTEPEDEWGFYKRLHTNGAIFSYVPEITWVWHHNSRNTNGKPHNW
jgi:hypothetical protein